MAKSHVFYVDVSEMSSVVRALADPTRQRVLEVLARSPMRTGELAEASGVSVSTLSRHLAVLRRAGLLERSDVDHDGRGRTYRLCADAMGPLTQWTERLAAAAPDVESAGLLARTGAFLDAFGDRDVGFFERHVVDDAQLVFPGMDRALGKQDVLDAAMDHPRWVRHEVAAAPTIRWFGGHVLCAYPAVVQREDEGRPRTVFVTSLFDGADPWQLVHLQWTSMESSGGVPR